MIDKNRQEGTMDARSGAQRPVTVDADVNVTFYFECPNEAIFDPECGDGRTHIARAMREAIERNADRLRKVRGFDFVEIHDDHGPRIKVQLHLEFVSISEAAGVFRSVRHFRRLASVIFSGAGIPIRLLD